MSNLFSELAKKHSPWSMSKAELAKDCGFAYHQRYVKKSKGTTKEALSGRIGKAAHAVLEDLLKGTSGTLKSIMYNVALNHRLTTPEIDGLIALSSNITSFQKRFETYKKAHQVVQQNIEKKFALTIDLVSTPYYSEDVFFRGVIDILGITATNNAVIVDHKSGHPPASKDEALSTHSDQLKLYLIPTYVLVPNLQGVVSALHYIQNEEIFFTNDGVVHSDTIRDKVIPWYYQFFNEAGEAAELATNKATATICVRCKFCEYSDTICPFNKSP